MQQRLVDATFEESAVLWKEIYQQVGVSGLFFQHRRAATLARIDEIALPSGSSVLEVGCGAGLTAVALAQRGCEVYAVDSVARMADLTRQHAIEASVQDSVRVAVADVHDLAFPEGVFDLVVAIGVIAWLHSAQAGMQQVARVLKPGGYVIASAANCAALNCLLDPLLNPALQPVKGAAKRLLERKCARRPVATLRRQWPHEVDQLLQSVGLQKIAGTTLGFGPFTAFRCELLPDRAGTSLYQWLQSLADRRVPGIRSAGRSYLLLAQKPG